MPLKILLFFLIFFAASFNLFAQNFVFGNVTNDSQQSLVGTLVINMQTDQQSFTDANGNYLIYARIGDELRFVRKNYERLSKIIVADNFSNRLNIQLLYLPTEIEEIDLTKLNGDLEKDSRNLNQGSKAEQLRADIGLPKNPEKPRERPSEVGKDILFPMIFASLDVQALYNVLSGKARRQKRLYKYQDFQEKITWLQQNIKQDFFAENGIADNQISQFLAFALIENVQLVDSVKNKNSSKATFILMQIAPKYLNNANEN